MPKVFISYSRRNKKRAIKLISELKKRGIDVWFDERDILVGHNLFDSIYNGIKKSDYFALILTKTSVKSKWVKEELDVAKQEEIEKGGTKIIPLLFEKCEIPEHLRSKKYADFRNFEKGMEDLIKCISKSEETLALDVSSRKDNIIVQNINSDFWVKSETVDDLFLSCLSFEDRSLWSIKNYPSNSIRNIFLFDLGEYSETKTESWYNPNKERFSIEASAKLVKGGDLKFLQWNNFNSNKQSEIIKNAIEGSLKLYEKSFVSVDISAFPQPYFLKLLQILERFNSITLKIFYASPRSYSVGAGSIGIKEIQTLPYGFHDIEKPNILIIFPGFFALDILKFYEFVKPDRIIIIVPKHDELIHGYSSLIESLRASVPTEKVIVREIPAADPFSVENELESLKSEYMEYNWWIVPQGTKLQSLGIHIFNRKNKDKISYLIWAKPRKYLPGYYTAGVGQAWVTFIK